MSVPSGKYGRFREGPLGPGAVQCRLYLVEGRLLALAHWLAADADETALLVGLGGRLGHVHHEVPVSVHFLGGRLLAEHRQGLAKTLGHGRAHVTGRADAFLIQRRGARYELVEELALPVPLARLLVDLTHRQRLADRASP